MTTESGAGWKGFIRSTLGLCTFSYLYHYGSKRSWQDPDELPVFAVDILVDIPRAAEAIGMMLNRRVVPPEPIRTGTITARQQALQGLAAYDEEMQRWVAEADKPVIELMDYRHPFTPSPRHCMMPVLRLGEIRKTASE